MEEAHSCWTTLYLSPPLSLSLSCPLLCLHFSSLKCFQHPSAAPYGTVSLLGTPWGCIGWICNSVPVFFFLFFFFISYTADFSSHQGACGDVLSSVRHDGGSSILSGFGRMGSPEKGRSTSQETCAKNAGRGRGCSERAAALRERISQSVRE